MTDAASLADRVREGDLRLHELEAHADADTAAEARRLRRIAVRRVARRGRELRLPRGGRRVRHREHGRLDPGADGRRRPRQRRRRLRRRRSTSPRDHRGRAPRVGQPRLLGHQQRRRLTARVLKSGMTRAPVFRVADVAEAEALVSWTRDNFAALKEAAEETTNHGELLDVTPYVVGNSVYLRFRYDTKDAMGMNMATIATEAVCGVVEAETAASLVALSGNLCSDKKPAAINAVEGRGRSVTADVRIPREVVEERLHTTPEAVAELNTRKNLVGSAKAASLGFNAHVANVVAAMFLATGQDGAQVVEGANAITTAEVQDGDLYVSVSIASLEVGTVGGGTKLRRSPGPRYPRRQRRRRPRRLQRRRPRQMHRRRFPRGRTLPSLRARLAAPLQRPRRTRSVTAWGLLSDRDS